MLLPAHRFAVPTHDDDPDDSGLRPVHGARPPESRPSLTSLGAEKVLGAMVEQQRARLSLVPSIAEAGDGFQKIR